ncbi:hypothetical protein LMH87_004816 [Akanthomyces muscarius]|uniref:Secreted protein n=1 Tax=Akanthomyces muscarius TaxID=2231603 RepID=A0A9W8Q4H6_AKAMU|nr:hypothetical protein LMH87_004816 [Akanthomyces muscarius]KAJ4145985.1 hypothetical protein LMH87_004816 [Akanthomyces muscarius]
MLRYLQLLLALGRGSVGLPDHRANGQIKLVDTPRDSFNYSSQSAAFIRYAFSEIFVRIKLRLFNGTFTNTS